MFLGDPSPQSRTAPERGQSPAILQFHHSANDDSVYIKNFPISNPIKNLSVNIELCITHSCQNQPNPKKNQLSSMHIPIIPLTSPYGLISPKKIIDSLSYCLSLKGSFFICEWRKFFRFFRRGGRVAEGNGLLNRRRAQKLYPGFESRPLRHFFL